MCVVGGDDFDIVFAGELNQYGIDFELLLVGALLTSGLLGLMALDFNVIIVSKEVFEPFDGFFRPFKVAVKYALRNLTAQACRGADDAFVVLLQKFFVYTGMIIESIIHIAVTDQFAEVSVPLLVLRQKDKVPSASVDNVFAPLAVDGLFRGLGMSSPTGTICLDTGNGLEGLIQFLAVIKQFFDAAHIAMVSQGNGVHAGLKTFINEVGDLAHSV